VTLIIIYITLMYFYIVSLDLFQSLDYNIIERLVSIKLRGY